MNGHREIGNAAAVVKRLGAGGGVAKLKRGVGRGRQRPQPFMIYRNGEWANSGDEQPQIGLTAGVEGPEVDALHSGNAVIGPEGVNRGVAESVAHDKRVGGREALSPGLSGEAKNDLTSFDRHANVGVAEPCHEGERSTTRQTRK